MQNPFLHASLSALIRDARCICKCTKKSINHFFAAHPRPPPASPPRVSTSDAVFRPTLGRIIFLFYIFASRLCMHSAIPFIQASPGAADGSLPNPSHVRPKQIAFTRVSFCVTAVAKILRFYPRVNVRGWFFKSAARFFSLFALQMKLQHGGVCAPTPNHSSRTFHLF